MSTKHGYERADVLRKLRKVVSKDQPTSKDMERACWLAAELSHIAEDIPQMCELLISEYAQHRVSTHNAAAAVSIARCVRALLGEEESAGPALRGLSAGPALCEAVLVVMSQDRKDRVDALRPDVFLLEGKVRHLRRQNVPPSAPLSPSARTAAPAHELECLGTGLVREAVEHYAQAVADRQVRLSLELLALLVQPDIMRMVVPADIMPATEVVGGVAVLAEPPLMGLLWKLLSFYHPSGPVGDYIASLRYMFYFDCSSNNKRGAKRVARGNLLAYATTAAARAHVDDTLKAKHIVSAAVDKVALLYEDLSDEESSASRAPGVGHADAEEDDKDGGGIRITCRPPRRTARKDTGQLEKSMSYLNFVPQAAAQDS